MAIVSTGLLARYMFPHGKAGLSPSFMPCSQSWDLTFHLRPRLICHQPVATEEEIFARREAAIKKLSELYNMQRSRLRRTLAGRRLAYVRERDAIRNQLAKLKAVGGRQRNEEERIQCYSAASSSLAPTTSSNSLLTLHVPPTEAERYRRGP